jgi:hypothetical protein
VSISSAAAATCLFAAIVAPALASSTPAKPAAKPVFEITFRPVRESNPVPIAVDVTERISAPAGKPDGRPFCLKVAAVYAGTPGIADRVQRLDVRDAQGPVPLTQLDDAKEMGGFVMMRRFLAERPVVYPVTVTYRSLVAKPGGPNGPAWALRESAGGVSASGAGFLVLPDFGKDLSDEESNAEFLIRVRWDLADMPPNSIGALTLGEGNFDATAPIENVNQSWFIAGPVERYPAQRLTSGFSSYWLGQTPFDATAAMKYAANAHAQLSRFFGDKTPGTYRVFMRVLQDPPYGGGTALGDSFMLSMGPTTRGTSDDGPMGTIVHEMVHHWVGGIEGSPTITPWFHEGLTVFYTGLIPLRTGLGSVADYERDINARAQGYFGSVGRNFPAEELGKAGFGRAEDIRHVPYNRGSLYFADLDAKIRAASKGTRKLDDVVFQLFERRTRKGKVEHNDWLELVVKELGPSARQQWEAVNMRGESFVPDSNAFGPCFERRAKTYQVQGKDVDGYEWVRKADVPDATCRAW